MFAGCGDDFFLFLQPHIKRGIFEGIVHDIFEIFECFVFHEVDYADVGLNFLPVYYKGRNYALY